jgi:aspartyl-tRNA(Asn)/glutamyl-tRNA(Gln) amidotransferase subunit C
MLMKLSDEEVKHIALLARLGLSKEEIDKFKVQLSDILDNFEILNQVDTDSLKPAAQSVYLNNVFRTDEAEESCTPKQILANSPQQEDDYFKVQAVLE